MDTNHWAIKLAIQVAKQANMERVPFQMGCVIFKNKSLISCAFNDVRSSSRLGTTLNKIPYIEFNKVIRYKTALHAEVAAILLSSKSLNRSDMVIVRVNKRD